MRPVMPDDAAIRRCGGSWLRCGRPSGCVRPVIGRPKPRRRH